MKNSVKGKTTDLFTGNVTKYFEIGIINRFQPNTVKPSILLENILNEFENSVDFSSGPISC